MQADKYLCGDDCPCEKNDINEQMYMSDPLAYDLYNNSYNIKEKENEKTYKNIQECSKYNEISSTDKIKVNKKFAQYWKNIEKRFNCVGFCQTSYYDENKNRNVPFTKYLFSDFTRGPVKHKGCFRLLMNWVIKALISFGSLGIAGSLIQILIVFAGINMLKEENDNDYQNQDNVNNKNDNNDNNNKSDNDEHNNKKNDDKIIQNEQNNN